MVDEPRSANWTARLLAPLAFFVAVTILVVVVQRSLDAEEAATDEPVGTLPAGTVPDDEPAAEEEPPPEAAEPEPPPETEPQQEQQQQPEREFYVVESGDTLEAIAERHDTTVERLLELNPDVDPLALSPGQRIRVS